MNFLKKNISYFIGIFLLILDQMVKLWVRNHPANLIKNDHLILGYGPKGEIFFFVIILLIIGLLFFTIEKPIKHLLALVVITSGVLGNFIDRLFFGGVIDYFKIPFSLNFVFNLADLYIIVGAIYYGYQVYRHK